MTPHPAPEAPVETLAGLGDTLAAPPDATLSRSAYAVTIAAISAQEGAATVGAPVGPEARWLPHITIGSLTGGLDDHADLLMTGLLGEGGMGRVAVATQRSLGREVAVKSVRPDRASSISFEALLHEARLTGMLEHPNVIPVHALGCDDAGNPVMVMKRVEGVVWRDLLRDEAHPAWGALPGDHLGRHLEVLGQICNAVHFAHSRGVVHRDLKPDNVMVGAFGEVYLLDWGIALKLESHEPTRTVVGTPIYMAPEMLDGEAGVSPRTDVFLLGATLHEVLTGRPRHEGVTVREVLSSVRAVLPYDYGPTVPAELAAIANRATSAAAEARFADALAFRNALADFVRHRGSVELAEEGARLLAALRGASAAGIGDDASRIRKLAAECRFAFQQALRVWDGNARARSGLQACLVRMIELELASSNRGAVEGLLAELPEPRPDLAEALAALDTTLRGHEHARVELTRLAHESDVRVSARQRNVSLVVLLLFAFGITARHFGTSSAAVGIDDLILFSGSACALGALVAAVGHRAFLRTRINRQIAVLMAISLGSQLAHRLVARLLGTAVPDVIAADLLLLSVITAAAAATLRPALWLAAVVLAVATVASGLVPARATDFYGVSTVLALALMVLAWRPERPPEGT